MGSPTPPPSLRSSPELTTSSILCTPREPSSIGTSVKVWKKVSSPKPVRISLPSRRITKKSVSRPPRVRAKRKAWSDRVLPDSPTIFELANLILLKDVTVQKKKKKKKKSTLVDTTA